MSELTYNRPSKEDCYLNLAEQVALRSTCLRRNFGAVLVNNDEILATGYGGAPRNTVNCTDVGYCYRDRYGARKGEHYEFCRAVHAEQNAIIQARRVDMIGSTLYLVGLDAKTKELMLDAGPCRICRRSIINAGIKRVVIRVGKNEKKVLEVDEWVKHSLWEFQKKKGEYIPVEPPFALTDPVDKQRRSKIISRFQLADAHVVQIGSYDDRKHTVGRAAARFFISTVKQDSSIAISCGDTILSMIESLPYRSNLELQIHQLSLEGDASTIHQAPSTLVGLLRGKTSSKSKVYGLQLPPLDLGQVSIQLRKELLKSRLFENLRQEVRKSDFIFIGVGSAGPTSESFWSMAQAATDSKFSKYVKEQGIVGEINNQLFDQFGKNISDKVPGFSQYFINVLTLDDIKNMAANYTRHKVVMVATGIEKIQAMRVALENGFANVLITGNEDADRLLAANSQRHV